MDTKSKKIMVGRFGAAHGVRGWIKIHSFTEPRANILTYLPWLIEDAQGWHEFHFTDQKHNEQSIIVKPANCDTPEQVRLYTNKLIAIERALLPASTEADYYWTDLEGLKVINQQQQLLGIVDHLFNTGANDVLVVKGDKERLLPYHKNTVLSVDLANGIIQVDWDADF